MSKQANTYEVKIYGPSDHCRAGVARVRHWDQKDRVLRGLKALGLCWGLALVAVFIPLAHFVLVPSFFIAGPIWAWKVFNETSTVLDGEGVCPECKESVTIVPSPDRWPLKDRCGKCYADLLIERV